MPLEKLECRVEPFLEGRPFGDAGAFEVISGVAEFAVDPMSRDLAEVTDLDLAPADSDGRVRFSATFSILRPTVSAKRNGRAFLDLPNRGGVRLLRNTNISLPPPLMSPLDATGDGWLLKQGYTVICCGWQHDLPDRPGVFRADLPEARIDGERIRGVVICHLEAPQRAESLPLGHAGHMPYDVLDIADPASTLKVRDHLDGPAALIPRSSWSFAKADGGGVHPDPGHVWLEGGFEPGKHYELEYTAIGAVPTALGLVGVRDFLSYLRFATVEEGNPCAGDIDHLYAFGCSQTAGVLRVMHDLDLFRDAAGRPVVDGYIAHGAGAYKSEVNWRFGQPSPFGPRTACFVPPFDSRTPEGRYAPKAIHTMSAPDYWDLFGALSHVALDGTRDLPVPGHARIFYMAGLPHVRGAVGDVAMASMTLHPVNILDFGPFLRAAIVNLDLWIRDGVPFPPSRTPTLSAGTLIDRSSAVDKVVKATGEAGPLHPPALGPLDFGPRMDEKIIDHAPKVGPSYRMLACDVDVDGNDVDGLLHPEVSVPLATYLAWNIRPVDSGAPGEGVTLIGAMLPFPVNPHRKTADPRRSITERYASREAYLESIRTAASALIVDRMVLAEDEEVIVKAAGERWDHLHAATAPSVDCPN